MIFQFDLLEFFPMPYDFQACFFLPAPASLTDVSVVTNFLTLYCFPSLFPLCSALWDFFQHSLGTSKSITGHLRQDSLNCGWWNSEVIIEIFEANNQLFYSIQYSNTTCHICFIINIAIIYVCIYISQFVLYIFPRRNIFTELKIKCRFSVTTLISKILQLAVKSFPGSSLIKVVITL